MEFIKSPLNYTGNKYRILKQIVPFFPKKINCMMDLFCGGATVGLNVEANKVIFVDSNERVINLLIYLSHQNFEKFLINIEKVITSYGLSYSYKYGYSRYRNYSKDKKDNNGLKEYNSVGYYKLRDDYNALPNKDSDKANLLLYVLMVYAFNNDIRFNSDGDFNLPIGKTDLNARNIEKVREYINRTKNIKTEFVCTSFDSPNFNELLKQVDFIYRDPPYLLGDAVYNSCWNNEMEHKLLDFIDRLIDNHIEFALSNVLTKVGKTNEPLSYWLHKNSNRVEVHHINYNYRSASYNKITRDANEEEILVCNKRYKNED